MDLKIIAYAHNGFTDKFGIPRQSRDDSALLTRIVFEPVYRVPDALRGIEGYSHLWLLWGFSANRTGSETRQQSFTVRPPRLGGNTRMGVFATRSPFRPNPIGLTCVRLLRVETDRPDGPVLVVQGADLMDGTPIYDIKPYLSFSDSHPDARNGFAEAVKDYSLQVVWSPEASAALKRCCGSLQETVARKTELDEILSQDPRPAYHADPERVYRLDYAGVNVSFSVDGLSLTVLAVQPSTLV